METMWQHETGHDIRHGVDARGYWYSNGDYSTASCTTVHDPRQSSHNMQGCQANASHPGYNPNGIAIQPANPMKVNGDDMHHGTGGQSLEHNAGYPEHNSYHCAGYYNLTETQFTEAQPINYANTSHTSATPSTINSLIQQQEAPQDLSRQSGFVTPVVDQQQQQINITKLKYGYVAQYDNDPEWTPPAKRHKMSPVAVAGAVGGASSRHGDGAIHNLGATPPKRVGGRRPYDISGLSEEEAEKKRMRRERNKLAAAKCRQRRVDHTNVLINKTECLEEEKMSLEEEIQTLQQQKDHLEFLLTAHRPVCDKGIADACHHHDNSCCGGGLPATSAARSTPSPAPSSDHQPTTHASLLHTTIKSEYTEDDSSVCSTDSSAALSAHQATHSAAAATVAYTAKTSIVPVVTTLSSASGSALAATTVAAGPGATTSRPNSLAIGAARNMALAKIAITTPSKGVFTIGLDSLADGHTGLTPLTGVPSNTGLTPIAGLTPCSTAHRNSSDSSPNEGISSPTLLKL